MSEKIVVPVLGESITEATVAKWLKSKGDSVEADEPIVELETDKVNLEVPSPVNGVISEINFKDGDTVEVGTVLGTISENKEANEKKKENVKMHLKDLRLDLKKIHLAVTKELLLPEPDEVKTLIYKMDQLLKVIESN